AIFGPEARGSGACLLPALDRLRSARQRLQELVANCAGFLLVGRGGHPAGTADGWIPLASRPDQPNRRTDAIDANHRIPARVHRAVRDGRGHEGSLPVVRHVLLPSGGGGGRGQPCGPRADRDRAYVGRTSMATALADVPRIVSLG